MNSIARVLLLAAIAALVAVPVFLRSRALARRSAGARKRQLARNGIAVGLGLMLSLWMPHLVPETPGSPGSLVAIVLLWFVGGGLALLGGASLAGALAARPGPTADDSPGAGH
jgi:hypothetical protein